jgi:hypothetical protein
MLSARFFFAVPTESTSFAKRIIMQTISQAARAIQKADAVLITAGAGMGVDSGLPDFRGDEGFWKAYPPFAALLNAAKGG